MTCRNSTNRRFLENSIAWNHRRQRAQAIFLVSGSPALGLLLQSSSLESHRNSEYDKPSPLEYVWRELIDLNQDRQKEKQSHLLLCCCMEIPHALPRSCLSHPTRRCVRCRAATLEHCLSFLDLLFGSASLLSDYPLHGRVLKYIILFLSPQIELHCISLASYFAAALHTLFAHLLSLSLFVRFLFFFYICWIHVGSILALFSFLVPGFLDSALVRGLFFLLLFLFSFSSSPWFILYIPWSLASPAHHCQFILSNGWFLQVSVLALLLFF